jgi:hypothetical protein
VLIRCSGQLRLAPHGAAVLGLDLAAVLSLARALGYDLRLVAELLPPPRRGWWRRSMPAWRPRTDPSDRRPLTMEDSLQSWDGKTLTPVHDRIYRRSPASYGPPNGTPDVSGGAPSQAVTESVRQALLEALEVDIGNADSLARFRDERRREIERLAWVERQVAGLKDAAMMIALGALCGVVLVIVFDVLAILLRAL